MSYVKAPRIAIPLRHHVYDKMTPHPQTMELGLDFASPDATYVMTLLYVKEFGVADTADTLFFSGRKGDLEGFVTRLETAASQAKGNAGVVTLEDIASLPPAPSPQGSQGRMRAAWGLQEVELVGGPSSILEMAHVVEIRKAMPKIHRNYHWTLLYRLSVDGCSYQTMYHSAQKMQQVVLVGKNEDGDRFGAFLSCELKPSRISGFTGNGQTFVFKLDPQFELFQWNKGPDSNSFFVAAGEKELVIGGGGGPALYFGADFLVGRTKRCATFRSPPLARREQFRVIEIELWGVTGEQ
jgi:hypothetical protein